jgi:hypothetical protein
MSEESRGQQIRNRIAHAIENQLSKYCPNPYNKMANLIAYDFNLCPDTLKYRYFPMFIDAGILEYNHDNLLVLTAKGQRVQTTEDGLTPDELKVELEEENEQRAKLGKPKISFEEWKKKRQKRTQQVK